MPTTSEIKSSFLSLSLSLSPPLSFCVFPRFSFLTLEGDSGQVTGERVLVRGTHRVAEAHRVSAADVRSHVVEGVSHRVHRVSNKVQESSLLVAVSPLDLQPRVPTVYVVDALNETKTIRLVVAVSSVAFPRRSNKTKRNSHLAGRRVVVADSSVSLVRATVIGSPKLSKPRIVAFVVEPQFGKVLVKARERRVQRLNRQSSLQHDRVRALGLPTTIRPRVAAQPNEPRAHAHSPRRLQHPQGRRLFREQNHHCQITRQFLQSLKLSPNSYLVSHLVSINVERQILHVIYRIYS